jgi:hypothetical protein
LARRRRRTHVGQTFSVNDLPVAGPDSRPHRATAETDFSVELRRQRATFVVTLADVALGEGLEIPSPAPGDRSRRCR